MGLSFCNAGNKLEKTRFLREYSLKPGDTFKLSGYPDYYIIVLGHTDKGTDIVVLRGNSGSPYLSSLANLAHVEVELVDICFKIK